jgi:L-asparaginase II
MIAGSKRYCTDLIVASKGRIIGKTGADGVYSIAIPAKKWGICIKIDDGKMGPQYNVAQALLEQLNLLEPEEAQALSSYLELDIRNWSGMHTGSTRVTAVIQNLTIH